MSGKEDDRTAQWVLDNGQQSSEEQRKEGSLEIQEPPEEHVEVRVIKELGSYQETTKCC